MVWSLAASLNTTAFPTGLHGPYEIQEDAVLIVTQVCQIVREIGEIVAEPDLQVLT